MAIHDRGRPVPPDVKLAMLAARNSGALGERAYKKVFDLNPSDLHILAMFASTLAEYKELEMNLNQGVDKVIT